MSSRKNRQKIKAKRNRSTTLVSRVKYLVFVVLPMILLVVLIYSAVLQVKSSFQLKNVFFTGNGHLTDEELKHLAGINGNENMITVSSRTIFNKMISSPWIRSLSIRKEFPDTLHIHVREAEPFALLNVKGHLFIVDEGGKMLQELKESPIPFLPVISGDPYKERAVLLEALHLARAIKNKNLLFEKDHIEIIANEQNEMSVNLDGVIVKIGKGDYEDKLFRLKELEKEIKRQNMHIDYIDLRFANRAVVKPMNEVIQ
jgi:cell division protein FtsQ